MKKIDDSPLYFYFGIITLVVGLILGIISFYSIIFVESEAEELLSSTENVDENFKKAYIILRDPHIFGKYEYFDSQGMSVKNSLVYFDKLISSNSEIDASHKKYIDVLLDRRKKASRLTRNTMIFMLLLSFVSCIFYFYELKQKNE